jgi:hypothetical protein
MTGWEHYVVAGALSMLTAISTLAADKTSYSLWSPECPSGPEEHTVEESAARPRPGDPVITTKQSAGIEAGK